MPILMKKKKVEIAEVRRFKDHLIIYIKEKGRITTGMNLPLGVTPEEIDVAVKAAFYVEIGERVPELEGREIEVEYAEETDK